MVEVVFGENATGSLKLAQAYGKGAYLGGAVGVILHEDGREAAQEEIEAALKEARAREKAAWESAIPLGGNAADVFSFPLALSVGDISEDGVGARRAGVLRRLMTGEPEDASAAVCEKAAANLSKIQARLRAGESVRIWYSHQSDEMCGLYWLVAQLAAWQIPAGQVFLVRVPDWQGGDVRHGSWGDVAPGEWGHFLPLQRQASCENLEQIARGWAALQAENAPLRAVVNGSLCGVPEDFYDFWILQAIAAQEETFYEGKLAVQILEKYRLGIGAAWIALRVENLVQGGRLAVQEEAPEGKLPYHRWLRKTGNGI